MFYREEAAESLKRQQHAEAADSESFEEFWQRYYRENYALNVAQETH
jgi:hypothetical protein